MCKNLALGRCSNNFLFIRRKQKSGNQDLIFHREQSITLVNGSNY